MVIGPTAPGHHGASDLPDSGALKAFDHVDGIAAQRRCRITTLQHKHGRQAERAQTFSQAAEIAGLQGKGRDRVFGKGVQPE